MINIKILSNNALKIIACIFMVVDHVGLLFFDDMLLFRGPGRIAFPLFAFCLAEGCFYTRNKIKHFALIAVMGILMLLVEYLFVDTADFPIFISFALSILLIYLFDDIDQSFRERKKLKASILIATFIVIAVGLNVFMYFFRNFDNNYGYYGVIAPVLLYIAKKYLYGTKWCIYVQMAILSILFVIRTIRTDKLVVLFSFISLIFLFMYNGTRGKWKMKYFFYIFYPLHFVILYGIVLLIG